MCIKFDAGDQDAEGDEYVVYNYHQATPPSMISHSGFEDSEDFEDIEDLNEQLMKLFAAQEERKDEDDDAEDDDSHHEEHRNHQRRPTRVKISKTATNSNINSVYSVDEPDLIRRMLEFFKLMAKESGTDQIGADVLSSIIDPGRYGTRSI